ncbi:MAG: hemolysin family protein [Actinomycetota bacterium]
MSGAPAGWLTAGVVALVVVAALLAAVEAALGRLTRPEAARLVADGRRGAVAVQQVLGDLASFISSSTLLRVTAETAAVVAATIALAGVLGRWPLLLTVASLVMAVATFLLVGVAPRTLGRQHAEAFALVLVPVVRGPVRAVAPLARLLVLLGNAVTPGPGFRDGPFSTENELRELVDLASESEVIEAGERQMIHSVFELGDTLAREVMVPRTDMVSVDRGTSLRKAMNLFLRSGFSRVPVIGDSVDDLLGVLYLKDTVRAVQEDPDAAEREVVEHVMREPVFVPESKPVDDLLREMQRDSTHVAVVVDEYGGTAGLVTIEDILEEIVGDIVDEYDRETPDVEPLEEGTYRVSARLPIDELGELFDVEIDEEEVDSVGGLLAKALGKVPIPGATATVAGLELTAERREGRRKRIATVLVRRIAPAWPDETASPR